MGARAPGSEGSVTVAPFVVIGCGAAKRKLAAGETCAAVDLYTGPLFLSRLAYARALGGPHAIVSARHGVVAPDAQLAPYEHDLRAQSKRERVAWSDRVAHHLAALCPADRPIVALVSGPYASPLRALAGWHRDRTPRAVTIAADGLALGEQRAELARLTAEVGAVERELDWFDAEFSTCSDDEEVTMTAGAWRAVFARLMRSEAA